MTMRTRIRVLVAEHATAAWGAKPERLTFAAGEVHEERIESTQWASVADLRKAMRARRAGATNIPGGVSFDDSYLGAPCRTELTLEETDPAPLCVNCGGMRMLRKCCVACAAAVRE